jgi:hypothetical protein
MRITGTKVTEKSAMRDCHKSIRKRKRQRR